jgi:dienelactone hydrolase
VITLCEFERAKIDVQIAFDRDGKISGLALRPAAAPPVPYALPPYASPAAYAEEEVTIGGPDWPLPATLAMPVGPGPFPAVVLVHGSGPNDRDETLGPNKPFKDLASGLASRGVVVLRYDKRTKVHAAKSAAAADFTVKQEVLDDVVEAVRALRANPKVDRARVFVLGHSLGGMLIPRIGAADGSLAGLIVLAGAARSLEDAILEQTRYIAMGDGAISAEEQSGIDNAAKLGVRVRALTAAETKSAEPIFGAPASYWLDLRGYDPPSAAKALKQPMLVLQGERDYQVTMAEFEKWKAALGGRTNVTFRSYPALNHLFIAGTGKSLPAEYNTPGHVAEDVVRDLAAWIKR